MIRSDKWNERFIEIIQWQKAIDIARCHYVILHEYSFDNLRKHFAKYVDACVKYLYSVQNMLLFFS